MNLNPTRNTVVIQSRSRGDYQVITQLVPLLVRVNERDGMMTSVSREPCDTHAKISRESIRANMFGAKPN